MTGADYVVNLLLNNSDFAKKLSESKNSVEAFKTVGSGAAGMLLKLAGTFGVAMGASEAFDKIIRGSQATSDRFDATMRVCETSVNEFFSAISTGNFTAFNGGLDGMITRAKAAYSALDQLANTMISFDLASYDNQLAFDDTMDKYRKEKNPKKKAEYKKELNEEIKTQKELARTLSGDIRTSIDTQISEHNPWYTGEGVSDTDLRDIVKLDADDKTREAKRNKAIEREEEFNKRKTKIYWEYMADANKNAVKFDREGYNKEIQGIAKDYQKDFATNKLLQKDMDDKLKETKDLMKQETSAKLSVTTMQRKLHAKDGSYKGGPSGGGGTVLIKPQWDVKHTKEEQELYQKAAENSGAAKLDLSTHLQFKYDKSLPELEAERKQIVDKMNKAQTSDEYVKLNIQLEGIDEDIANFKNGTSGLVDVKPIEGENVFADSIKWANDYATALQSVAQAVTAFNTTKLEDNSQGWTQWVTQLLSQAGAVIACYYSLAMAAGTKNAMKFPFPANLGILASLTAAVISVFASLPSFSEGGIFEGLSDFGDRNIARVNSGEMILNNRQQKNLFNLLNGNNISSSSSSNKVEFKIRGSELIGVLNNYDRKIRKV